MIKLIVFDWDDVFTVGTEGYFECYHQTLVELGIHLPKEEEEKRIKAKWGKTAREELKELLKENFELLDSACKIYEERLFDGTFLSKVKLIDAGIIGMLERLSKNYTLAIATGMNSKLLKEQIMPKFQIPQVFSQIISAYDIQDVENQKPSPFMVQKIMQDQGYLSSETILVGDSKGEILMARGAQITPVIVLTGHLSRKEAEEFQVEYIISSVTELEQVLQKL